MSQFQWLSLGFVVISSATQLTLVVLVDASVKAAVAYVLGLTVASLYLTWLHGRHAR